MLATYARRAVSRCQFLGQYPFSEDKNFLFRPYLSNAYKNAQQQIQSWMHEAGMQCRIDPAGNLIGSYGSPISDAPILLIGSHMDTVKNAGCFDGNLGVMLGIELIDYFHRQQKQFPFTIELIAFGDEEGSRFPVAMLTSKAVAGLLSSPPSGLIDDNHISIEDAFLKYGLDFQKIQQAAYNPQSLLAYFEIHIEQGPVLESKNLPVGIVSGIAAQLRFQVTLFGQAGHAGTTTMNLRKDTMAGAAEIIFQIEQLAKKSSQTNLVVTTGQITASPGASNIIAGKVTFSIDLRAPTNKERDQFAERMRFLISHICQKRKLELQMTIQHDLPASSCDPSLISLLQDAVKNSGNKIHLMTSGAGHDAMIMKHLTPMAMLFIRSPNGISHSPQEQVLEADVEVALHCMIHFINLKENTL